jgi:hypothetical protein
MQRTILAGLLALLLGTSAHAGWAIFQATSGWSTLDGSLGAPAGVAPQLAGILNGLTARPPWSVAGVDYGVGYPAGQTFLNPVTNSASLPPISGAGGCAGSSNNSTQVVTITGTGTCNFNGWDFTDWQINIANTFSGTLIVTNSKFAIGAKQLYPITSSQSHLVAATVSNNTFDSGGASSGNGAIGIAGATATTVMYNYFARWDNDVIRLSNYGGDQSSVVKYNVMQSGSWASGPCANLLNEHPDQIHAVNGAASIVWQFNTSYQPAGDASTGLPGSENSFLRASDSSTQAYNGTTEIGYNTWMGVGASGHQNCHNTATGNTHSTTTIDNIDTTTSTGLANDLTLVGARVNGPDIPPSSSIASVVTGTTGSLVITPSPATGTHTATSVSAWTSAGAIGQIMQYGGVPGATFTASISGLNMAVTVITGPFLLVGSPIQSLGSTPLTPGTVITACPGGNCTVTGTYTVNNSQSVGSESMSATNFPMQAIIMHDNYFYMPANVGGAYGATTAPGSILSETRSHNIDMSTGSVIP